MPDLRSALLDEGTKPPPTAGSQIGRWYKKAGGLDRAIEGAQQAMDGRDFRVLDSGMWPTWQPEDVTQSRPAYYRRDMDQPGVLGWWDPRDLGIRMAPDANQAALEHELTHHYLLRSLDNDRAVDAATAASERWPSIPLKAYLTEPPEVDARIAEIKRRYAHFTGRLVNTPEEAKEAWEWWRENQHKFHEGKSQQYQDNKPSLTPKTFEFYDSLPGVMKEQIFHRMPELVQGGGIRKYIAASRGV